MRQYLEGGKFLGLPGLIKRGYKFAQTALANKNFKEAFINIINFMSGNVLDGIGQYQSGVIQNKPGFTKVSEAELQAEKEKKEKRNHYY